MKKTILLTLLSIIVCGVSAFAQDSERYASSRLDNYANQLKRRTVDLVDRTSERITAGTPASRSDIEEAFLASQMDAGAGLFQQMTRGSRRASELREAAALLTDLARRAPGYGANSNLWRDVQNSVAEINRELGGSGNGGENNPNPPDNRPIIGRAYWRGMVDDKIQLVIRGGKIEHRTISGRGLADGTYSFTSELPNRQVAVAVEKQKGRGSVTVVQQPSRANDFTTVIEIYDNGGGSREYQIEVFWR